MAQKPGTTPAVVSKAQIQAASQGDQAALKALLTSLVTAQNTLATQTSTSSKTPPNQSSATISFQNPLYIVTFTDPGGAQAASLTQAAQQASLSIGANSAQSVIYHQVQSATSVLFDAASGLITYGGDAGNLNTQFVIDSLDPSKSYFFRVRTSYDGVNWNQWLILNNKTAVTANPNGVLQEPITGGSFATITLPGAQKVGFAFAQIPSGSYVNTAQGVLIENCIGIAAPATVNDTGNRVAQISSLTIAAEGETDLTYESLDGTYKWDGNVNYILFGFAAGSQNLTEEVLPDGGRWIIVTLAGGTQIAFGYGMTAPGTAFLLPEGYTAENSMGVCTPASGNPSGNYAHGIYQSDVVDALPTVLYADGSGNHWTGDANWFAVAWPDVLTPKLVTSGGGKYLIVPTPSGNLALGVGSTASGAALPLPAGGYTYAKSLAFSTPGSFNDIGNYMHGVKICSIDVGSTSSTGEVFMIYTDGTEAVWDGNANWFALCWL